jgi:enoyl-[acyl-carrier-protein] reductase (NADH)
MDKGWRRLGCDHDNVIAVPKAALESEVRYLYLSSSLAANVIGQILIVDAGNSIVVMSLSVGAAPTIPPGSSATLVADLR